MNMTSSTGVRGLSLLETVIWIGMFAMAMTAIISALIYFYRTSNYAMQGAEAVTSAQPGIHKVVGCYIKYNYSFFMFGGVSIK